MWTRVREPVLRWGVTGGFAPRVRSKKVKPCVTGSRDLAFSRPIPVGHRLGVDEMGVAVSLFFRECPAEDSPSQDPVCLSDKKLKYV